MQRKEAIAYLQSLQTKERSRATQAGVTQWGALVAVAGIAWQLLNEWEYLIVAWPQVQEVFARLLLAAFVLRTVLYLFVGHKRFADPTFMSTNTRLRGRLLTQSFYALIPIQSVAFFKLEIASGTMLFIIAISLLVTLLTAWDEIRETQPGKFPSLARLQTPDSGNRLAKVAVFSLLCLLLVAGVYEQTSALIGMAHGITPDAWMISVLLTVAALLVLIAVEKFAESSELEFLENLERDLVLGTTNTDSVVRRLELHLVGSRLGRILDSRMTSLETRWQALNLAMERHTSTLPEILAIPTKYATELDKRKNEGCRPLVASLLEYGDEAAKFAQYCSRLGRLTRDRHTAEIVGAFALRLMDYVVEVRRVATDFKDNYCSKVCPQGLCDGNRPKATS